MSDRNLYRKLLPGAIALAFLAFGTFSSPAAATDLTIGAGGRVTLELIGSDAKFRNTLSITSPSVAVEATGCRLEPAKGLNGVLALSEKISQRGCRVNLDGDPSTGGVQPFADGTTFRFRFCAQKDADADCEFLWSSNAQDNSDDFDHLITTDISPAGQTGQVFRLAWEDDEDGGDQDFNDLIAVLRVERDTDGDGLWDDWETTGIDTDGDGSIDLDLPALGADPNHKDLFLEIDWMDCAVQGSDCGTGDTHNHRPNQQAVNAVIAAFANANVSNPDGVNGINLHVDVNNAMAHQRFLRLTGGCFGGTKGEEFDARKADNANFGPNNPRRFAYRYAIFGHLQTNTSTSSGCGELPGNDFLVTMGGFAGQTGTIQQQAGTLMHEFGHTLNLHHGGGDDANRKSNYLSIMSYTYQLSGLPPTDPDGSGPLTATIDYSRAALPNLLESALSEPAGVGGTTNNTIFWNCPGSGTGNGAANAALNWNCDADATDTGLVQDLNGDGNATQAGFFDWSAIKYDFQTTSDFDDGERTPVQEPEIDFETYVQTVAPELSLGMTAAPAVVLTGSNVTYTITVANNHPEAAANVVVLDTLPSTVSLVSCAATDNGACAVNGKNLTVTVPALAGGAKATITVVVNVDCAVADGSTVLNSAVLSLPEPDVDPGNDRASASVTASNPAPVLSALTADKPVLGPPDHKLVDVVIGYTVTDNCGVPVCTLDAASNEAVNGTGDGDASPDWVILDDHHVRLRAERSGNGNGRVYTIGATCTDSAGTSTAGSVTVNVPKGNR
ncbi:MAG: hypothetical protein ACJ75H_04645 [Thermoanaerobaculia bacterium]